MSGCHQPKYEYEFQTIDRHVFQPNVNEVCTFTDGDFTCCGGPQFVSHVPPETMQSIAKEVAPTFILHRPPIDGEVYEAVACKYIRGSWVVEAFGAGGDPLLARFYGVDPEKRAKDYANLMNLWAFNKKLNEAHED